MAVDDINNSPTILPDVELDFVYNDTSGLAMDTANIIMDHVENNVTAFIGPEGPHCNMAAR